MTAALCPRCECPLHEAPPLDCSAAPVHRAAAIELGRYALLVATVEGELQAVRVAAHRLPVLVSCADCIWRKLTPHQCILATRDLPDEDVIPEWCPMRGKS